MAEEFDRLRFENKKLTEMLAYMHENYNALQSHLKDLESNHSDKEFVIPRKRKAEIRSTDYNGNNIGVYGNIECSSSSTTDEESCKRPKESYHSNPKDSRISVRTEAYNPNLVSSYI